MKVDSGRCGVDKMVIKTNENFGGDTVTYSVHHITVDGRIYHRESLADSDDPIDRNISILGFGERFFRYREAWAIRQLMLKLKDQNLTVRHRAMDEILSCFDFSRGIFPRSVRPSYKIRHILQFFRTFIWPSLTIVRVVVYPQLKSMLFAICKT